MERIEGQELLLTINNFLNVKKSIFYLLLRVPILKNYLDFKFKNYEYNDNILQLIISIIKSQDHISEFNISQIKNNFELILLNLLLLHRNTLISIRLDNVFISDISEDLLKQFCNIKKIKLIHCNKLTSEVLADYSEQLELLKIKR